MPIRSPLDQPARQRFDAVFADRDFRTTPAILAVIHVTDEQQARRNAQVAIDTQLDGVFCIDHGNGCDLGRIRAAILADHPGLWVGLNRLDLTTDDALRQMANDDADGLWVDDGGVDPDVPDGEALRAADFDQVRSNVDYRGLYFAGVAFKYQKHAADPAQVARRATEFCDVICTSGPGTGQAADVAKLQAMREAVVDHPLAVASGVTPQNIHEIRSIVDAVLVATGICSSFTELDPELCRLLVDHARR